MASRDPGASAMTATPIERMPENGLPTWAKVVYWYGIPAAIAGFLVWFVTQGLSNDVRTTREMLQIHANENGFYLRAICLNVAQTDGQRAQCFPPISPLVVGGGK